MDIKLSFFTFQKLVFLKERLTKKSSLQLLKRITRFLKACGKELFCFTQKMAIFVKQESFDIKVFSTVKRKKKKKKKKTRQNGQFSRNIFKWKKNLLFCREEVWFERRRRCGGVGGVNSPTKIGNQWSSTRQVFMGKPQSYMKT